MPTEPNCGCRFDEVGRLESAAACGMHGPEPLAPPDERQAGLREALEEMVKHHRYTLDGCDRDRWGHCSVEDRARAALAHPAEADSLDRARIGAQLADTLPNDDTTKRLVRDAVGVDDPAALPAEAEPPKPQERNTDG